MGAGFSGVGVTGGQEPPNVATENWTGDLWKRSSDSLESSLQS